jgi:hypothetical protein
MLNDWLSQRTKMEPTNEFRWLELYCGDIWPNHPTAQIINGTNRAIVLQQKFVESYAFNGGPVPDGKQEWRDIHIVSANA